MKKILVSLSAFAIGVFAFNLLYFSKVSTSELFQQIQPVDEDVVYICSMTGDEEGSNEKVESFIPFFDSFDDDEGFDGWFIAANFKGMKEVWAISLDREWANEKTEKLVWSSTIRTKTEKDSLNEDDYFHSISIKTDKSRLSFATNKIRGIEYKFEGEFSNSFYKFEEGKKALKGTLQKIVNGKKVAEFTADFKFYEPKCLH
jgi:hypothetical protein